MMKDKHEGDRVASGPCLFKTLALGTLLVLLFVASPAEAEEAQAILEQARAAYKSRHLLARAKQAVELYGKAIDAGAGYEALWEGARSTWFLGELPMKNNSRGFRTALFDRGRSWALEATKLRPEGVEGLFWHGVLTASWASTRGLLKSLRMRHVVRQDGEAAIRINGGAECGGPYRLMGRYYHKIPRAYGGDHGKAIELFQKSIELCPGNDFGRMFLAEVLIDENRNDEARQQLEAVLAGPTDPRWSAERRFVVEQAKTLLENLGPE